jgi:hypothetical protein
MILKILLTFSLFFFSGYAHAQMSFNQDDMSGPSGIVVSGDSIIDRDEPPQSAIQTPRDDADSFMDPEKTAPAMPEADPFKPSPMTQAQQTKRVLKKMPAAKIERTIADDRIDDDYVQKMIRDNLDYSGPIE